MAQVAVIVQSMKGPRIAIKQSIYTPPTFRALRFFMTNLLKWGFVEAVHRCAMLTPTLVVSLQKFLFRCDHYEVFIRVPFIGSPNFIRFDRPLLAVGATRSTAIDVG